MTPEWLVLCDLDGTLLPVGPEGREALVAAFAALTGRRADASDVPIGKTADAEAFGLYAERLGLPRGAWRAPAWQAAYADHLATPEFARGLERLLTLAEGQAVAVLCAEAVPWRCHRWLLADALVARGHAVHHILSPTRAVLHALHPGTEVRDGVPTYPARDAPGWVAGEGP